MKTLSPSPSLSLEGAWEYSYPTTSCRESIDLKQRTMTKGTGETISFKQAIGSAGEFISKEKTG